MHSRINEVEERPSSATNTVQHVHS